MNIFFILIIKYSKIIYYNIQYSASPPFFYNNTNNYIIIKIKYLLELKIKLKNYNILIWHYIRF